MAAPSASGGQPVTSKRQLVEYLEQGCKSRSQWRIGTEHEKFAYDLKDKRTLPYDGRPGIQMLLDGMQRFGWIPVAEGGNVVALRHEDGGAVTLEPGGQFELSGAQLENIHQTCNEVHTHLGQVREICDEIGAGMLGHGFNPKWARGDIPWMPKGRYKIMREYMPKKGSLGLDMMLRTCTVQVNLDFESDADMVRKMRVALALQPIATALFANSPFTEGKPNGFLSYRSHIWTDTDPDRCGMLPFVFEDGFGFERWVDYLLDVPMYFVYRDGAYIDMSGKSFRDFMAGRLEGFKGQIPNMGDWTDHMTTVFPEVRLKRYIEMRGADGGPWGRLCALPALWVGIYYDRTALDAAWDLCKDWTVAEMEQMRAAVPRLGLKAPFRKGTVQDLARETVAIAAAGLRRRAIPDVTDLSEEPYIEELKQIAESGITPAERLLDRYKTVWKGNIDKLYEEESY
jgi:glutamate--cysteine ligase